MLRSTSDAENKESVTWFTFPYINEGADVCELLLQSEEVSSFDMSDRWRGHVEITALSSEAGATLEFFIGTGKDWYPISSTYNTGNGDSVIFSHTFTRSGVYETFSFYYDGEEVWDSWEGRKEINIYGFRSRTNEAEFSLKNIDFGIDWAYEPEPKPEQPEEKVEIIELDQEDVVYKVDYAKMDMNCFLNELPNNGGILSSGGSLTAELQPGKLAMTSEGFILKSTPDVRINDEATWFGFPTVHGAGETSVCVPMFQSEGATSFDMSENGKVIITAKSDTEGAVLEFYLGTGEFAPISSTYNNLGPSGAESIIFFHEFKSVNTYETFAIDYEEFEGGLKWVAWEGRKEVNMYGFRSGTNDAVFQIKSIDIGPKTINQNHLKYKNALHYLNFEDADINCYADRGGNHGGLLSVGASLTASGEENAMTDEGFILKSTSDVFSDDEATWFGFPVISEEENYDFCRPMSQSINDQSIDMSENGKVIIFAKSDIVGATLEFYLGNGDWAPTSSTYNNLGSSGSESVIFSHTFKSAGEYEKLVIDYEKFEDGLVWGAWEDRNKVNMYGFRSRTNDATFQIKEIVVGAEYLEEPKSKEEEPELIDEEKPKEDTLVINPDEDSYYLEFDDETTFCFAENTPNDGGLASLGSTFTASYEEHAMTADGLILVSTSDAEDNDQSTWFGFPEINEGVEECELMYETEESAFLDMSEDGKVTISATSSVIGGVLEFFLGAGVASDQTNRLGVTVDESVVYRHVFTTANQAEVFTIDYESFEGSEEWSNWDGKSEINMYGFRSGTNDAVFEINGMEVEYEKKLSLNETANVFAFEIYPNPAHTEINFTYDVNGDVEVELSNTLGSTVSSTTGTSMDVSELPAGVYFATLKVDGVSTAVQRVQVQ